MQEQHLCDICPVKNTCGIYIGMRTVTDGKGHVFECNRYDYYTGEETTKDPKSQCKTYAPNVQKKV